MNEDIKRKVLSYRQAAEDEMQLIRKKDKLTPDFLYEHLFIYIKRKFMLDDEDCPSDIFSGMIETSLAKSLKISPQRLTDLDIPGGCDGASSAVSKKVMLLMKLQKEFDITLPPAKTAGAKTIRQLSDLIYSLLPEDKKQ